MKSTLWVERYPALLTGADEKKLKILGSLEDMPHILFYGPPGCGKRSRANQLVNYLYGADATVLQEGRIELESKDRDYTPTYQYFFSKHHLVIEGSEYSTQESVQALDNLISTTTSKNLANCPKPFLVLIITECHLLGSGVQAALRRIIEQYSERCRVIFITTCLSNILPALQSRSFLYRCPRYTPETCATILEDIWRKETKAIVVSKATKAMFQEIISLNKCNLKKSILDLQIRKLQEMRPNLSPEATISQLLDTMNLARCVAPSEHYLEPEDVVGKALESLRVHMKTGFTEPYEVAEVVIDTPTQYHSGLWREVLDLLLSPDCKLGDQHCRTAIVQQYLEQVAQGGHPITEAVYLLKPQ